MSRALFALVLGMAACTCAPSGPAASGTRAPANPLLTIERFAERHSEASVVTDALEAGSYQYLRLEDGRWLATLHGGHHAGDPVSVVGIGQATDFHSARLDRTFPTLIFAVVRTRQASSLNP